MKKFVLLAFCLLFTFPAFPFKSEIQSYLLSDGEQVTGRLCTPQEGTFSSVVFVVHGTGLHTHRNYRKGEYEFNFYDELAREFCARGMAFFSYDRRGVTVDEEGRPPFFVKTDTRKYAAYPPSGSRRHRKHDRRTEGRSPHGED